MLSARVKRPAVTLFVLLGFVFVFFVVSVVDIGTLQAAGPISGPRTTTELARAGAQHSEPRAAAALCSNPAALAGLRGLHLQVEGNIQVDARRFTPPGGLAVQNTAAPTVSPGVFAAYNLAAWNVPGITLGVGWFATAQQNRTLMGDAAGPQRYVETRGSEARRDLGLGLGYELPWLGLRLGATVLVAEVTAQHSLDLQLGSVSAPVALSADAATSLGGLFALAAAPFPWLALAVSYQLPQDVRLTGLATLPPVAGLQGSHVDLVSRLPGMVQGSVQYRDLQDRFDVELVFAWENWRRSAPVQILPASDVTFNGGQIPELDVQYGWRDAWSLRLGARYRIPAERAMAVNAGAFYELGAVDDAHLSVAAWDPSKWGLGAGAKIALLGTTWIEGAAGLHFLVPTTVTQSRVRGAALNARNAPTPGPVAGNGRYGGFEALFALALGAALDL